MKEKVEPEKVEVVTSHKYTHYIRIPAKLARELGLKLNSEVYIDKSVDPDNPLNWEIRIKPVPNVKREGKGKAV